MSRGVSYKQKYIRVLQYKKTWKPRIKAQNKSKDMVFFQLGFTPCKAEQPLQGMELQEKEAQKNYSIQETCLERTYS